MNNADEIRAWIKENFDWLPEREKVAMFMEISNRERARTAEAGYQVSTWTYADGTPVRYQSSLYLWADPNASDMDVAKLAQQRTGKGALSSHLEIVQRHRWIELRSRYRTIKTAAL